MTRRNSPYQRTLRARVAALTSWANTTDRSARTAQARAAALDRIDAPHRDPTMSEADEAKRIEAARRAHFTRLALRSAEVRRNRRH